MSIKSHSHVRLSVPQRGVSLIELIVFILIISVGVVGILAVMNKTTSRSSDPLVSKQAMAIAESFLEEIQLQNLASSSCIGTLTANAPRSGVVSVCDYDGYSASGVRGFTDNALIGGLEKYDIRSVTVTPLTDFGGTAIASAGSAVAITVTVVSPNGEALEVSGYRAGL